MPDEVLMKFLFIRKFPAQKCISDIFAHDRLVANGLDFLANFYYDEINGK